MNFEKQNFEAWKNSVSDSDYEKLKDAFVLLIEKEIVDEGNEDWKTVIPAPYDTNMVKASVWNFSDRKFMIIKTEWPIQDEIWTRWKEELCVEKCPIALEWSEWSCQCQRGSVLNEDKDLNPAGIPTCDCGTDRRYRVQACKRFDSNTPSCNIYHDPAYVSDAQDATCKNYNFNTEKPESIFLGPEDVTRITVRVAFV